MTTSLRVGVIGVGVMGADHAERIANRVAGARLTALADPVAPHLSDLAAGYAVTAHTDPLALIADEQVDAVIVASPGSAHEQQVLACIERGIPVLCEKPLTMDSESSLRCVRAEAATGRRLVQVGFMRRFDPEYAALRRALTDERIGRLLMVHNVHRNVAVPNADFRSEMIVRDSLVHEVDVARYLFGQEIAEITVLTPTPTRHAAAGVLDPQLAIFRMTGGALVTTEVFCNSQTGYEVRCEAVGETGSITIGRPDGGIWATGLHGGAGAGRWGGDLPADYRTRFGRAYDLEVQAWVDAARRGDGVGASSWDGYAATVVSTAGMQSLATSRPVEVVLEPRPTSA